MRYKLPIIDGHYHSESLIGKNDLLYTDAFKAYLDSTGMDGINVAALATTLWDASNTMICMLLKTLHDNVFVHGHLAYEKYPVGKVSEGFDPLTQYHELMAMGCDGIKMLETKPTDQKPLGIGVDDAFYEPFFAACEKDGTHLLWHVADPEEFWDPEKVTDVAIKMGWAYTDGSFPEKEEFYRQAYAVFERHPNLKVTLAHFFFLSADGERLAALFDKYPNVNVDLTPGCEMYGNFGKDPAYWRDFFIKYQDRIEFGTDAHNHKDNDGCLLKSDTVYQFLTTDDEMEQWGLSFRGLNLPEDVCRKILKDNFVRRVSATPKKLNPEPFKAYCQKYLHLARDEQTKEYILNAIEKI